MRWVGYQSLAISKLKVPGDIKERMGRPRVMDLANSIGLLGDEPMHAPVVEREGLVLIAGRDRIAALMRRGAKKVNCHIATDVSDKDRLDLEIDENLHRRQDDRDKLIARRVAKVQGELLDKMSDNSARQPGRPKSEKAKAREVVARELDTTPEAVRAAERRAAEPEEPEESTGTNPPLAPPVETWGVPVEHLAQEFASVRIAQEAMRAADRHLQQAQRALAALKDGGGVAAHLYARVYIVVHTAAATVRSEIPAAVCPYDKALMHRRERCTGCQGIGYVGDDALLGVADELKLGGAQARVPNGRGGFVLVSESRSKGAAPDGEKEVAKAAKVAAEKAAKKLQLQDGEGNPITVPPADEESPF
ncbi:MAG TPA: hypothetical protein VHU77_11430 [Candidatus Limnocylindria bacterium]|jgi:hypothetical protein|nr:hypothetical protein [Candidatus Limnocylindria bacterium]